MAGQDRKAVICKPLDSISNISNFNPSPCIDTYKILWRRIPLHFKHVDIH